MAGFRESARNGGPACEIEPELCDDGAVDVGKDVLLEIGFVHHRNDRSIGDADDHGKIVHQHQSVTSALTGGPLYRALEPVELSFAQRNLPRLQTSLGMRREPDAAGGGSGRIRGSRRSNSLT